MMLKKSIKGIKSNQKGFSMIEIIIGITLIGIMGAALAPSFMNITRKTKLKADIQSVQTLQNMIDIYSADHDGKLPGNQDTKVEDGLQHEKVIGKQTYDALLASGYISVKDLGTNKESLKLQTEYASVNYDGDKEHAVLVIDYSKNTKIGDMVNDLSTREGEWVISPNE